LQRQAWQWALANRDADGSLPSARRSLVPLRPGRSGGGGWSRAMALAGALGPATVLKARLPLARWRRTRWTATIPDDRRPPALTVAELLEQGIPAGHPAVCEPCRAEMA